MPSWYNLNKWIRVLVTNTDIELIQKYKTYKKVPKSSLTIEEQQSLDMMLKKVYLADINKQKKLSTYSTNRLINQ